MAGVFFRRTADHFQLGSKTLPGEYYLSPEIFAMEMDKIGGSSWHSVGRASRIAEPGSYFLQTVAGEPLIILRDRHGTLRAHVNSCRHRGTRLCAAPSGRFSETIQCPYHAWTYSTDGRLVGAPFMQDVPDFVKADHGLHQARIDEWAGFLFVNLDVDAPPLAEWLAPLKSRFDRLELERLAVGHQVRYQVASNWKLIFQNYSECLHCPTIHPELMGRVPYLSGANDLVEGPILGGYMEIAEGHESVTASGQRVGPLISKRLTSDERRRGYYYSVMPNLLLSIHPDYAISYLLWPESTERTIIESEWLFDAHAVADPSFDPTDAVTIWDATNRQDWKITEESLAGIRARRYQPGPYSPRESIPAAWDRAYLAMLGD